MKIFLDTNIFPEFIDRRVTTGSGQSVTVTKYPDPDVTQLPKVIDSVTLASVYTSHTNSFFLGRVRKTT